MGIGRAVGGVAYVLARDLRRTAATNLRLAFPEKSDEERAQLVRGCFDSLGRLLGFFSQMSSRSEEELKDLIDVQGWENLEAAKRSSWAKIAALHRPSRRLGVNQFWVFAFGPPARVSCPENRQSADRANGGSCSHEVW